MAVPSVVRGAVGQGMTHRPYEHDLGSVYLTFAPAHLSAEEAALALIAHMPDISAARTTHALACRHFAITGDESRLHAYFAAADIAPDAELTTEIVAAARQEVERIRMLEWELTGVHPTDTDPDE